MSNVSGLAASIRSATGEQFLLSCLGHTCFSERCVRILYFFVSYMHAYHSFFHTLSVTDHETFDLAGSTASTIETTIRHAFAEPFQLPVGSTAMIRLTFVTGAGKLGRARYDDGAARALTATLRELGYEEDRGASAVLECAGSFKLQHDTGKNLKTVVVFPKIIVAAAADGSTGGRMVTMIAEDSIEHKLAYTTMNVFPRMMESKCETWSQKKGCVAALSGLKEMAESLDGKLMQGQPLTDSEQDFYNSVSLTSLEEKLACVRDMMAKQVDAGNITADEKQQMLAQVVERIEGLGEEIREAEEQGKAKRVENLKVQETKARARKQMLQAVTPQPPPRLKNEDVIAKLRKEQVPLLEIEEASKGRLQSLKESQSVARKDEIVEEILELELSSRGWFESDEAFDTRVKASRSTWQNQRKQAAAKKKPGASKTSALPATTKWVVPGAKKSVASSKPVKKTVPTGGGLFAAMMNDSDSD